MVLQVFLIKYKRVAVGGFRTLNAENSKINF